MKVVRVHASVAQVDCKISLKSVARKFIRTQLVLRDEAAQKAPKQGHRRSDSAPEDGALLHRTTMALFGAWGASVGTMAVKTLPFHQISII